MHFTEEDQTLSPQAMDIASKRQVLLSAISSLGYWARMLSENKMATVRRDDNGLQIVLTEEMAPFILGAFFGRGFIAANESLNWMFIIPWSRIVVPPRATGEARRYLMFIEADGDQLTQRAGKTVPSISVGFYVEKAVSKIIAAQFALDIKTFLEDNKSVSSANFGRIPVDIQSASRRSLKAKKKS